MRTHRVALPPEQARRVALAGLILLAGLLTVRLVGYVATFHDRSLQMDFSAFYTAGRSVELGLSPYVNQIAHDPPVWDGVNRFKHSRFLYPPPAAWAFRLVALAPYHRAKLLWMLASLAVLAAALWICLALGGRGAAGVDLLALGTLTLAFFPLLPLLERGQVDAFTLLLLVGALALICRGGRSELVAGALLALATLLKLHCLFLLPFLLLRRRLRAVGGFLIAAVVLLLTGLLLDGHARVQDYAFAQLPRISRYGESGSRAMLLPQGRLARVMHGVPPGRTVMDGRTYDPQALEFVLNASLVRTSLGRMIWHSLRRAGLSAAPGHVSLVLLAPFFAVLLGWQRWCGLTSGPLPAFGELIYWQTVLVVVLLCAPVTWAMNVVWLLPIAAILLGVARVAPDRWQRVSAILCALGLALAAAPDAWTNALLGLGGASWPKLKYVLAELVCLTGLLGMWKRLPSTGERSGAAAGRRSSARTRGAAARR